MRQLLWMALVFAGINHAYGDEPMKPIEVKSFNVHGIEISTTNQAEMESSTAKIPGLWASFYKDHYGKTLIGTPVYGVYTNYESDVNGRYSVVAGVKSTLAETKYKEVRVEGGEYLVFEKEGESPASVIAAWQDVWKYFAVPNSEYKRSYTTDFEVYESPTKVAVCIAIR
jgi:predicted transcriptional regulator YdeE